MNPTEIVHVSGESAELQRFMPVMSLELAVSRREGILTAFQKLMKEGQDYGKVPGAGSKPTLLQPGAQKLDNLFGLVPRFIIEERDEDWSGELHGGEPFFRYLIKCQVLRGEFVMGEAIGECNSWESKYRYRTAERSCPDCGKGAIIQTKHKSGPEEGKPKNFWCAPFKGGCGHGFRLDDAAVTKQETGRKPNTEIFDQVNTLLKMAQKRAHVAATINATSASEFFTQDLEDAPAAADNVPEPPQATESIPERGPEPKPASAPMPKAGGEQYRMLEAFRGVKADLRKVTDSDDRYYAILGAHGYEKSAQIKTRDEGLKIHAELKNAYAEALEALTNDAKEPELFAATESDLPEILKGATKA